MQNRNSVIGAGTRYTAIVCFFVMAFAVQAPAKADEAAFVEKLRNCKAIKSIVLRSQCYDEVLDDYDTEAMQRLSGTTGDIGRWKMTTEKSPLNDSQIVYLNLLGSDYITTKKGTSSLPSLSFRCADGKTEAYVAWDTNTGQSDPLFNYRVGKQDIVAGYAKRSGDNQATFIPDAQALATKMLSENDFYIKIFPDNSNPLASSFDIRGLTAAIQPVRKACNW
jgi:type VI secretion system protein VasI